MTVKEAANFINKWFGFPSIYYPATMQLKVFINVNGKAGNFVYDEEELSKYGPEGLANRLDDDLFLFGGRT